MLEDRPIAQKTLAAAGAFTFVFTSAMAGTAFMLTGGFGFEDGPSQMQHASTAPYYDSTTQFAPDNWRGDASQYAYVETSRPVADIRPQYDDVEVEQASALIEDASYGDDAEYETAELTREDRRIEHEIDQAFAAYLTDNGVAETPEKADLN
jgi:hypothetical protein